MGKILFWFVVITAILFAARLLSHNAAKGASEKKTAKRRSDPPDMSQAEAMVRCEHCGIHMPHSEAFLSNGHVWCGPEHARLGHRKP